MLYIWRVDKIRKRRDVKRVYYERWGPTILGIGLVLAVLVNFGLRARETGFMAQDDDSGMGHARIVEELWFRFGAFACSDLFKIGVDTWFNPYGVWYAFY